MNNLIISIIFLFLSYLPSSSFFQDDSDYDNEPINYIYVELGTTKINSNFSNGSLGVGAIKSLNNIDLVFEASFSYLSPIEFDYELIMLDFSFSPRYNFNYTKDSGFYTSAGVGFTTSTEPDNGIYLFEMNDSRNTFGFLTKLKFGYRLNEVEIYGQYRRDFTELESFNTFNAGLLIRL